MLILYKIILFLNILSINAKLIDIQQQCINTNYTYWDKIYSINISDKFNYIGIYSCIKPYIRIKNASIHYIETWKLLCNNSIPLNSNYLDIKYECKKKNIIKVNKLHIHLNIYSQNESILFILLGCICIYICCNNLSCCIKKYNNKYNKNMYQSDEQQTLISRKL